MTPDYYNILGIRKGASHQEIKQAYREKAKAMHPDVNTSANAHEVFARINEAYDILSDANKRYFYNIGRVTTVKRDPAAQAEYDYWIKQARERANKHAQMPLENFMNSPFYRKASRVSSFLFLLAMTFGVFFILYPFYRFLTTQDPTTLWGLLLTIPVGLLALAQGWIGYGKK